MDDDKQDYPDVEDTKIQHAIHDASPGDTSIVYPGTYEEQVDMNRKLTLKDIDYPVVDGLGCGHTITMSAGGCVFDGFEVTNSAEDCAGIYVQSEDNIIRNNIVNSHEDYGIYLDHSNFMNNDGGNVQSYALNIWCSTEEITYVYKGTTHKNYRGNYWDDYEGSDADKDGIGDTPYGIKSDNDEYPLMKSFEHYF